MGGRGSGRGGEGAERRSAKATETVAECVVWCVSSVDAGCAWETVARGVVCCVPCCLMGAGFVSVCACVLALAMLDCFSLQRLSCSRSCPSSTCSSCHLCDY